MPTKREERLQRAAARKQDRERQQRQQVWRSRGVLIAGALALLAIGVIVRRQRQIPSDGRVWSSAHGHWHDRFGVEIR